MRRVRFGLLGTSLAISLAAFGAMSATASADGLPPGAQVLYTASGVPVAILVPPRDQAVPADMQVPSVVTPSFAPVDVAQIVARQQAMMNDMMVRMQALMGAPTPGMPGPGPGIVATADTGPVAMCSETVTIAPSPDGGAPHVTVRRQGNACAPIGGVTGATNPAAGVGASNAPSRGPQFQPVPMIRPVPSMPADTNTIRVHYVHPTQDAARLRG